MDLDKELLVTIALSIHFILTGMALMQLYKLKSTTGGVVISSIFAFMIPVVGPSGLIIYLKKLHKQNELAQKPKKQPKEKNKQQKQR